MVEEWSESANGGDDQTNYLIVDTDMGSDDAWALMMILRAEQLLPNIKLLGITCVHGNATLENVVRNTRRILERAGRCDVHIFEGAEQALIPGPPFPDPFHGYDGMADLAEDNYSTFNVQSTVRNENAIEAIRAFADAYPKRVTLLCLGPLTNIALAFRTYRGLSDQFKEIFLMGGNYRGIGNTSRCAEFNFYTDPEAAHIVLLQTKCPVTILPWEACMEENLDITIDWRLDVIGNVANKFVQFLNIVERKLYAQYESWMVCDALLTAAYLFPHCIKKERAWHATVELAGHFTRGQVVVDHLNKNPHNVKIIELLCSSSCKDALLWTANPDAVPTMHQQCWPMRSTTAIEL